MKRSEQIISGADMSEWIEWKGGECPVPDNAVVETRFRDGYQAHEDYAMTWRWNLATNHESPANDIIAYRIVKPVAEPEAHMMSGPIPCTCHLPRDKELCQRKHECTEVSALMSAPERKHVSDAAWEVSKGHGGNRDVFEKLMRDRGTVLLTVAEHDELVRSATRLDDGVVFWKDETLKTQALAGKLQAERDALRAEVERLTQCLKRANDQAEHFEREWYLRGDEIERLRKGKDETIRNVAGENVRVGNTPAARLSVRPLNFSADHALDHRLGIPQPEGEPCEPMSRRKPYRWGHL